MLGNTRLFDDEGLANGRLSVACTHAPESRPYAEASITPPVIHSPREAAGGPAWLVGVPGE